LKERCKKNKILNPENHQYSIFDEEDDENYKKKRSEYTVFKHDHLRTWEITNALGGGATHSMPLSPSHNTNYNK
jgi:hypothetical protein